MKIWPIVLGALAVLCIAAPDRAAGHLLLAALIALYMLPTIIAVVRHSEHAIAISCLNIFLGWTFLGWVAALVWSFMGNRNVTHMTVYR